MHSYKIILSVMLVIFLMTSLNLLANTQYMQARIYFDSKEQLVQLRNMNLDIALSGDNFFEIITDPQEYEQLQGLGFRTEMVNSDLVEFYQSRLDPNKDMGGYMTLDEINAKIDTLIMDHPSIISNKISLGLTIEGRDIWAFKISDNPNLDEDEIEVLYTSAIHAREVITPLVIFYFVDHVVDNYATDPDIQNLVDNREIWIVPCVNPDGYYYNEVTNPYGGGMWRKNRRNNGGGIYGVDLNRNFGYMWGYDNVGSSPYPDEPTYRGTAGFSEPETQHMRDFHLAHDFIISVYFHSHSNVNIWPWGYDYLYTPDHDIFAALGDSMEDLNGYESGTVWEAINYTANGSSDDWIYAEQTLKNKTFAFTIEVGTSSDGFWPELDRIPALTSENLGPLLFLTEYADNPYIFRAPAAPSLTSPDSAAEGSAYDVTWSSNDTLNPAIGFELVELSDHQRIADSANNFGNCLSQEFVVSTSRAHSGPTSFFSEADNKSYKYVQYEMPFEVEDGDTLRFWTWYDIESNWDYGYVEVSTDGISFATIPGNITTDYNPNGTNRGHGITGSSGGWTEGLFNLSSFAGQSISVRLAYQTDTYMLEEGIYYDDIFPVDIFNNQTTYALSATDSSYTISGNTEGEYYYMVRAKDAQDQWGAFSGASQTTVYIPQNYICGDANGDEEVNVSDAIMIINYVFVPGSPSPSPIVSADVDCEGNVNISDAVYIINFVFVGGSDPCDPDGDTVPDC
jgi:hypothetical protein